MSKKKSLKISKSTAIYIVILILFTLFLINIPNFVNENQISVHKSDIKIYGESEDDSLKVKYQVIVDTLLYEILNTQIQDYDNKYVKELIIENKVYNRENTIAQEMITLYKNNKTQEVKNLSQIIIENKLNEFDEKNEWVWRNYLFYITEDENHYVLYERNPLLIDLNETNLFGFSRKDVQLYEFQLYTIELFDDINHTVKLNLFTGDSEGNLSDYIDINTNQKKKDIKSITSSFLKSDFNHSITFIIWK